MKTLSIILLLASLLVISTNTIAQERDSLKRREVQHLRQRLNIDEQKAQQVEKIQSDYKTALYELEKDSSLGEEQKRIQFRALVATKNRKLEQLLDAAQQQKMIPATEREARSKQQADTLKTR